MLQLTWYTFVHHYTNQNTQIIPVWRFIRIIGFKYNASNQATHSDAVLLQLHPRPGNCCGILREKRTFTITHASFDQVKQRKNYTHSLIWLLWLYQPWVDVCWLFVSGLASTQSDNTNSQPAAEQMNTTQAHTFETNIHPLQTLK